MKDISLVLPIFFLFFSLENLCCVHESENDIKAELCKYYVAYFESETEIKYFNRLKGVDDLESEVILGDLMKLELITDNYRIARYPNKFLDFEIYLVYPNSPHAKPYKLGIDAQLKFFKFGGFVEDTHLQGDTSSFLKFNDELDLSGLNLFQENRKTVDQFIADWIQLTRYDGAPNFFKLISNNFKIIDRNILGECKTVEYQGSVYESEMSFAVYKIWQYELQYQGKYSLKAISEDKEKATSEIFK